MSLHPAQKEYTPSYGDISGNILEAHKGHRVGSTSHSGMPPGTGVHSHPRGGGRRASRSKSGHRLCEDCSIEHPMVHRQCANCKVEHSGCCNAHDVRFFYQGSLFKVSAVEMKNGEVHLVAKES